MEGHIDENRFFREATLRICGQLEIEHALAGFMEFVAPYIPADRICLDLYDKDLSALRCIAIARPGSGMKQDSLSPLSPGARSFLSGLSDPTHSKAILVKTSDSSSFIQEILSYFELEETSAMVLVLVAEQQPTAGVILFPKPGATFTEEHLGLLTLLREPFAVAVSNAIRHLEVVRLKDILKDDNTYLQGELRRKTGDSIVGANFGLRDVIAKVGQVARHNSPVLISGETGTGKEVIANAIHNYSQRSDGPFISVNCGAIPESLIDSELFGHEKGAFTGAIVQRRGRFERANGGTIFLDEIGELPLSAQVRFLRVLQDRTIERVGGTEAVALDIRVIAATNRNLDELVRRKLFREDLWFRLNVFPIHVPPLRDRRSDIPALVWHFIVQKSKEMKLSTTPAIVPDSLEALVAYDWPGNVRELQNVVERALILAPQGPLEFRELLPPSHGASPLDHGKTVEELNTVMAGHIRKALEAAGGRVHGPTGAAALLRINPSTLRYRMSKLGIRFGRRKGS